MIVPFVLLALAAQRPPPIENPCANGYTENVWDPRFAPGQRWSYRNRPVDQNSTLVVTQIDNVPGIGLVIHITVDNVDLLKDRGDDPNRNRNLHPVSIAIRRDSLDASVLDKVETVPAIGPDSHQYDLWKKNCGGRTYASTVADAMQTEHESQLIRKSQTTIPFAAMPVTPGRRQSFKLSLSTIQPAHTIEGSLLSKDGAPIKDAEIEIQLQELMRGSVNSANTAPIKIKTAVNGSFEMPALASYCIYSFRLSMDGFKPVTGKLTKVSPDVSPSLLILNDR